MNSVELEKRIAEALGWTDVRIVELTHRAETQVVGVRPGEAAPTVAPKWMREAGAALELAESSPAFFALSRMGKGTDWVAEFRRDDLGIWNKASAKTIAEAVGRAFLNEI